MVTAQFSNSGDSLLLSVTGHADKAEYGRDLVCAAASMLAYTAAQCVLDMDNAGKLKTDPEISLGEGSACVRCEPKKEHIEEAMHTYRAVQVGYQVLAHNYPDHVLVQPFD